MKALLLLFVAVPVTIAVFMKKYPQSQLSAFVRFQLTQLGLRKEPTIVDEILEKEASEDTDFKEKLVEVASGTNPNLQML